MSIGAPLNVPVPVFRTKHVAIRPIVQEDISWLHQSAMSPEFGFRWRYRGHTPSPEQFVANLWEGVLAQFVVVSRGLPGSPVGLVVLYEANTRHGHCKLGVTSGVGNDRLGLMAEGAALLIEYAFGIWPFTKLYAEIPGFNLPSLASITDSGFVEEGRLERHEWHCGEGYALHIFALYRDRWEEYFAPLRSLLLAPDS